MTFIFAETLQETIKGLNQGFHIARSDLNDVVAGLRESLVTIDHRFSSALEQCRDDSTGITFRLTISFHGEPEEELERFQIPHFGYPIRFGISPGKTPHAAINVQGELSNRQELDEHFLEMLKNPTSPLIVYVAYEIRKHGGKPSDK